MPQILTANDLLRGDVVFFTGDGWSRFIDDARVAHNTDQSDALEDRGREAVAANLVVEPYLIEVDGDDGSVMPKLLRERMRSMGPSVRTDLGKQADQHGW